MTSDVVLIDNSRIATLPLIGQSITIGWFYTSSALLLVGIFTYFQYNFLRLMDLVAELPAVFPDGTPLFKKVHPWLLNSIPCSYFKKFHEMHIIPILYGYQWFLSLALIWILVPVTICFKRLCP